MKTVAFIFFSLLLLKLLAISLLVLWLTQAKGHSFADIKNRAKKRWSLIKARIADMSSFKIINDELA